MTSIRRRLLVWLLTTVLVAGFIAGGIVFMQAREQANQLFDYQLRQLALTLRDRDFTPGELARAFQETEQADYVIQVWTPDGLLLYRSHAEIDGVGPSAGQGFSDVRNAAGAWRLFTIWHRGLAIQVALTVKDKTLRKPDQGEVRWDVVVTNRDGETVAVYDLLTMNAA